jgi:Na+/proline symporter/CheY-like chemotaxis protein
VYCSSWTFYGAVGSATASAWSHAPIYLGPILMFLLGWPVIQRMLAAGARHQVTSVADYISARYGKRQKLGVLVTLVATAAVLPYIALQFKALAQAWGIVGGSVEELGGDTALFTAIILAVFTILFGTRRVDGRERHQGVMTAIALESLVKLAAFGCVAALALSYLFRVGADSGLREVAADWLTLPLNSEFVARTVISALAILCLPRQFHVMVVEAQDAADSRLARWAFPLYLFLFMILVVPICLAGAQVFAGADTANPDTWVQLLPIALESNWAAIAAFIGGISAATGMAIVATISLAIMITNEIVSPLIMRLNVEAPEAVLKLGDNLRRIRQFTIAGIMLAAWLVTRLIADIPWLAQIGFISFLAAAQLAPALLAGLYWRRGHGLAVIVGLSAGLCLWFYCAVLPVVLPADAALLQHGPLGIDWLRPLQLFGIEADSRLAYATTWSLGLNIGLFLLASLLLEPSAADVRQARIFMDEQDQASPADADDFELSLIRVSQLQALLPPFVHAAELRQRWRQFEERYQQRLLPGDRAPRFVVNQVESVLAGIIGATSAHKLMAQLEDTQQLAYADLAGMVSDASRLHTFNRELLQTTVESMLQGVSVVDSDLRLVAWNTRYEELFDYPQRFLYVGCPIERVYRYNASRGYLNRGGPVEEQIQKRLEALRSGSAYRMERILPDGTVVELRGNALPHGGYVTTYVDVTEYKDLVEQLQDAKLELESQVDSGRELLSTANARLRQENRLRAQVENSLRDAHQSKSRFMSATSHDLLQPINAARLFTQALKPRVDATADADAARILGQIDSSLHRAEQLISELREIARLDSGRQVVQPQVFAAAPFLRSLFDEFSETARLQGLQLRVQGSSLWLQSDSTLLRRIAQNLLSNAIKYTRRGKVLLGIRRRPGGAEIQVCDTGAGIAPQDQSRIFEEFERLHRQGQTAGDDGLGLGLSIVSRYTRLLDHPLTLFSEPGRGTVFSVTVPTAVAPVQAQVVAPPSERGSLDGLPILCLDNEPMILDGMKQLLESMGARVRTALNRRELRMQLAGNFGARLVLADYHLDDEDNGVAAVSAVLAELSLDLPCVIISADDSADVRHATREAGFRFMAKPVRQTRLRALVLALMDQQSA